MLGNFKTTSSDTWPGSVGLTQVQGFGVTKTGLYRGPSGSNLDNA